jgi:hypothetical protein
VTGRLGHCIGDDAHLDGRHPSERCGAEYAEAFHRFDLVQLASTHARAVCDGHDACLLKRVAGGLHQVRCGDAADEQLGVRAGGSDADRGMPWLGGASGGIGV